MAACWIDNASSFFVIHGNNMCVGGRAKKRRDLWENPLHARLSPLLVVSPHFGGPMLFTNIFWGKIWGFDFINPPLRLPSPSPEWKPEYHENILRRKISCFHCVQHSPYRKIFARFYCEIIGIKNFFSVGGNGGEWCSFRDATTMALPPFSDPD